MGCVPAVQGGQLIFYHTIAALVLPKKAPMVVVDSRATAVAHCLRFFMALSVSAWHTGCCGLFSLNRLSPTLVALRAPVLLVLL